MDSTLEHQPEINRRPAATEELIQKLLEHREDKDNLFSAISMLAVDAILDGDAETLGTLYNHAANACHPAYGLSDEIKGQLVTLIEITSHALMRYTPPLSDAELTYLQLADGNPYKKEKGSAFTSEERRLMQLGCMVSRLYWMELTPRGVEVLSRSRQPMEREASWYRSRGNG